MRIIRSYAEFLGQRYPASFDDKGRKYLGYIVDGAERMHQLTSDLLRYSRVGRGGLQREEVDTDALVDRVIAMFAADIHAQSGAHITRSDLPPVYGVETLLVQLFEGTYPGMQRHLDLRSSQNLPDDWIAAIADGRSYPT